MWRKYVVNFLLWILNSEIINQSPCQYGYINGIDAISLEELHNEEKQRPGVTVKECIASMEAFKFCKLSQSGLMVIENGEAREGTIWDVHELRQSLTPKESL